MPSNLRFLGVKNFNTLSTNYKGAVFNDFPQTIITMFRPTIKFEFPFIKG